MTRVAGGAGLWPSIMNAIARGIAALLLACLTLPAAAQPAADADARALLQRFTADVRTLRCEFSQELVDADGSRRMLLHGTLALDDAHRFRWQTGAPEQQLIVGDGKRIWIFDPELEQATVRAQTITETHSPLRVLTDPAGLDRDFHVTRLPVADGLAWLRLEPRDEGEAQFEHVDIGVDASGPRQMRIADRIGGESRLHFGTWERNPELAAGTFHFTPPPGVDVVRADAGMALAQ